VQLRDQLMQDFAVPATAYFVEWEGGKDANVSCPTQSDLVSSTFLCTLALSSKPTAQGAMHFYVSPGGGILFSAGRFDVIWLGSIIIPAVIGGAVAIVAVVIAIARWVKSRRKRAIDRLLVDYVGLDSGISRDELGGGSPLNSAGSGIALVQRGLVIPFEDIKILRDVAAGATGKVMLGTWRKAKVAVKQFFGVTGADFEDFVRECLAHHGVRHPNVVQLLGVCQRPMCVVTEWMGRGALFGLLQDERVVLPWQRRLRLGTEAGRGLDYLHSCNLLHRDVKSLNIFVDTDWHAKIGDLGQATAQRSTMTAMKGTLIWTAPEVLHEDGHYGEGADVYSFGIVLYELWTRTVPFCHPGAPKGWALVDAIKAGARPQLPVGDRAPPTWLAKLCEACWQADQSLRPSMDQVVAALESPGDTMSEQSRSNRASRAMLEPSSGTNSQRNSGVLDRLSMRASATSLRGSTTSLRGSGILERLSGGRSRRPSAVIELASGGTLSDGELKRDDAQETHGGESATGMHSVSGDERTGDEEGWN